MAVSTTNAVSGPFATNGATTVFPFDFTTPSADEVSVYLVTNGVETEVSSGAYSVNLIPGIGGSVIFDTAPVAGSDLYVFLDPEFTQNIQFENGSAWLASPVNEANDRAAARDQYLKARVDKLMPAGMMTAAVAGTFLAWDAEGNPIASSGTGADSGLRTDLAAGTGTSLIGHGLTTLSALLPLTPEQFVATAGTGNDDTAALRAMVAMANALGKAHIVLTAGKTYLLSHVDQQTLHFQNLNGLYIEGFGATLKSKDAGIPTTSLGHNWGQINIDNCQNVHIYGLTFDGNRDAQTHTQGPFPYSYGINFGINFWTASLPHTTSDVHIRFCTFRDHGNLTEQFDIAGDAIFAYSGVQRFFVEHCLFERVGRWCLAVAEAEEPSHHVYFCNNTVINGNRGDAVLGNYPWGAVDIEDGGLANTHIYVDDNKFTGTTYVAISGNGAVPIAVTVSDVYIRDNIWNLPSATSAADAPFNLGNGAPATGTYRTIKNLYIEDNIVNWAGEPMTVHVGADAKLVDTFIRRNEFRAETLTATSETGLILCNNGHMEGRIEITDNRFIGLGEAISNANAWFADATPLELELRIEGNTFEKCFRSYKLQFNDLTAPTATSKIIFRGNISRDPRDPTGEYIDGGGIVTEYHDAVDATIWTHIGLTYKGNTRTLGPTTVAALPAATAALIGARALVTDANATTFLSTVAGGGANKVPVVCDGAAWKIG